MATAVLRPTSTTNDDSFAIVGGATCHAVTDDSPADDATYVGLAAAVGDNTITVGLTDITVPAGSVVKQVKVRARTRLYDLNPATLVAAQLSIAGDVPFGSATVNWLTPTEHTLLVYNASVSDAEIDAATLTISHGGGIGSFQVSELYVDVIYLAQPVVSISTPSGSIFDETQPTVFWLVSFDSQGGIPNYQEVKIFDEETYSGGGFSVATSEALVDSGEEAVTAAPFGAQYASAYDYATILPDGNFRAYVRSAQTVNGELLWSAWDSSDFTISAPRPTAPTVDLTPDDDNGRVLIEMAEGDTRTNLVTNPKAGTNTTGWTFPSMVTGERVTSLPPGAPPGVTTGFHCVSNASADRARIAFTTVAGAAYRASVYVRLHSLSATSVGFTCLDSPLAPLGTGVSITTVGTTLIRYDYTFTAVDTTSELWLLQNDAGAAEFTFTGVLVELDLGYLAPYFDGDSDDATWSGTANNSTSTEDISTDAFYIQRSGDGGGTWANVRTGHGSGQPITSASSIYDYHAPNGVSVMYRVSSLHTASFTEISQSAFTTETTMWESEDWWFKHPTNPLMNLIVPVRSLPSEERGLRATAHYVLGRATPVVVSDAAQSPEGEITVFADGTGGRASIDDLVDDGVPVLIQAPNSLAVRWPDRWVRFIDSHTRERIIDNAISPDTYEVFHWVEVSRPGALLEEAGTAETGDPLMIGGM